MGIKIVLRYAKRLLRLMRVDYLIFRVILIRMYYDRNAIDDPYRY